MDMNYRDRCYQSIVSKHWAFTHSLSEKEFNHSRRVYRKKFNSFLPPDKKKGLVLDVACGAGHFLYYLQKEGYINAQGIDISEEQLQVAKKIGVKNIQKADLFDYLPKHPGKFDMVVANDIIEHLKKDEVLKFLDLIFRALKPSGRVLIATVNAQSLFGARGLFITLTHEQAFTPESLSEVMRICNFKDVKVYGDVPVAYDWRSALRTILWSLTKEFFKLYSVIERGTGRGMWKHQNIYESRIFAVGTKPDEGK